MNAGESGKETFLSKSRLVTLVDSTFAFAMTLLVVSLTLPEDIPATGAAQELPGLIAAMFPQFVSFVIAFFILASFWIVHHRHFHYVRILDARILWLNLCILMSVVFLPFTTNLSGDYSDVWIAVLLFHINLFLLGFMFWLHWHYISHHSGIVMQALDDRGRQEGERRARVVPGIAALGMLLTFINPGLSVAVYLFIPVFLHTVPRVFSKGRTFLSDRHLS